MRNIENVKSEWVEKQQKAFKDADPIVLQFISDVLFHGGESGEETIRRLFDAGYCYYFAHMLKSAFGRGQVCYAYYVGHFVWLDGVSESKDIAYDINGVSYDWEHLIPEEKIGDGVWDFKHVKGRQSGMEDPEIISLLLSLIETGGYAK